MKVKVNLNGNFKVVAEGERVLEITDAKVTPSGKPEKLQLTMNDEEKLNKIREFLQKSKSDKNIITDNCIICLNPLNMDNNIDDPNNEYSISTLQCGHK